MPSWGVACLMGKVTCPTNVGCLSGSCCRTVSGLRSACRDIAWTIMALVPCVRKVLNPVAISLWCPFSHEIWFKCFHHSGWHHLSPTVGDRFIEWWLRSRKKEESDQGKKESLLTHWCVGSLVHLVGTQFTCI
jgi:hypothetical protein